MSKKVLVVLYDNEKKEFSNEVFTNFDIDKISNELFDITLYDKVIVNIIEL